MLYEVDWAEDGTYRPDEYNSPEKFFNDCLENSKEFDLQLGYFSSATISVLADGFATFISNGGKMRLVINHIVSEEDKEAIRKGIHGGVINCFDLSNFETLRQTFDEYQQQFFECLAFLIYDKRIDIRIIRPRNKKGISHTKSGQFRDGDSITSFTGSANFTINGLFNNLEEIKIDRSDSVDMMVQKRIASQREDFDTIMSGKKKNVEYLSPDNLVSAIKSAYGDKDIEDLLDVEKKLRKIKEERAIREKQEHVDMVCEDNDVEPRFPYPSGPRDYQKTAFENWKNNGQKGLFSMATGTGKTITSLNCLLNIYNGKAGCYKAIILVPTTVLVDQWAEECKKFHFDNVVKVYSKNSSWKKSLDNIILQERISDDNKLNYVVISTYASFARDNVFTILTQLPRKKVLFIADECHNIGAGKIKVRLPYIPYLRRIGLSATPKRQFDDAGNNAINEFFGIKDCYTFEYTMKQAINEGKLCQYYYYPHVVYLNSEEMKEYNELSIKLAKFYIADSDSFKNNDILMALFLKRKRIIHKASGKKVVFSKILKERIKENGSLKYSLIYVPEGNETSEYFDNDNDCQDVISNDDETQHLIEEYTRLVAEADPHTTVMQFTGETTNRKEILEKFAKGQLDVLTSMKCLDEGVDVPRSEMAIFCASTGNPRQFIQRRGRILRTHEDKMFATIHDLVVAPKIDYASPSYKMERNLLNNEMNRVREFANLSLNSCDTVKELEDILTYYNLPTF